MGIKIHKEKNENINFLTQSETKKLQVYSDVLLLKSIFFYQKVQLLVFILSKLQTRRREKLMNTSKNGKVLKVEN